MMLLDEDKKLLKQVLIFVFIAEVALTIIAYFVYGTEYVVNKRIPGIVWMIIIVFVFVIVFYIHEYGHYYAIKHYYPELSKDAVKYGKTFFIPSPNEIKMDGSKLNGIQHIVIRLAGIIGGFVPLFIAYIFFREEFYVVCILYFLIACFKDFYDIAVITKYIIKNRKISLEDS